MSTMMAAEQTSMVHLKHASPSVAVIDISEEEERCARVDNGVKVGDFSSPMTPEGTRSSPIFVAPFRNGQQGSKNEPICLDEIEGAGDYNHPILVEDSQLGEALAQFAIKESLMDLECFEIPPYDLKGKRPKRERRSRGLIREVGESSSSPPKQPDAYCSICMEAKFKYDCFTLKNCSHTYCASCVSQYVEAKVGENVTSIRCPDLNCKDGFLEPEMCQLILKPEVFNRWGIALCEAMIGSMKFYCPYKDCSALLIDDSAESGGEVITQSECPHCFRLFCAKCKVPWHTGLSCEEVSKLGADERGIEDIMLKHMAKDSKWQRCPNCKFYVEKVDGCMLVKCRCGHCFCYGCGRKGTADHYCSYCRR